ncbi:hypothetical protein [Yoonia sp. 2307UL14-13]|uniref:hypothetical protein n=1 Tax=Yoonia sp. 2307UL14-13 TaxID=3126506 RepID=UPI0030B3FE6B
MTAPTEDDFKHWGIACYCFSLDLSDGLVPLAIPAVAPLISKQACREAIIRNREHITHTGRPTYMRDLVRDSWQGSGHAEFDLYVEQVFISPARRSNLDLKLLRPLNDADRLAAANKALADELDGESYAAALHSLISTDISQALFDTVMEIDSAIDGQKLTNWDEDLIARNSEIHSPESPLTLIIHTLMQSITYDAAHRLHDRLSASTQQALNLACEAPAHA